jgi:hypothetical protein
MCNALGSTLEVLAMLYITEGSSGFRLPNWPLLVKSLWQLRQLSVAST